MPLRALYVDLDGTLLGPGGALLRGADGRSSLAAAEAIAACADAGVEVVVLTGRRQAQAMEDARLLGGTSYVFEGGACVVVDGEEHWTTAPWLPGGRHTIFEQIQRAGAEELLLERYRGRLEHHAPWHTNREVSHLFRGLVDVDEAAAALHDAGIDGLRLMDNGVVHSRSPALADLPHVRCYHLLPEGASKRAGVALHRELRGHAREDTLSCGDSREDLTTAAEVGRFALMANGLEKDPAIVDAVAEHPNALVTAGAHGAGVLEAVRAALAA